MKLVDILARELKEWPTEAREIAQDSNGLAHPYSCAGSFNHGQWDGNVEISSYSVIMPELADDFRTAIVTRAQWQAAVEALRDPLPSAWNGEGLPPVGTVCEAWHSGSHQGEVTVLFIGSQAAVLRNHGHGEEQCGMLEDYKFRPIRTAEQIAAEEREKSVREMLKLMPNEDPDRSYCELLCEALYDAGYRKQVQPSTNEVTVLVQRLREYVNNPHHVCPPSERCLSLVEEISSILSQKPGKQVQP